MSLGDGSRGLGREIKRRQNGERVRPLPGSVLRPSLQFFRFFSLSTRPLREDIPFITQVNYFVYGLVFGWRCSGS
jgi:hypothetical protein